MDSIILKKLFWEVDESTLSFLSEKAVITRTLSHGGLEDIQNLFSLYGKEKIQEVFLSSKTGVFSKRRYSYFKLILV
jgi:hypothetical protein